MDMTMKWNNYPSNALYLWDGKTLFKIYEGNGTNLSDEDEAEGYVDYWMTDYYDYEIWNGGQWMESEYIRDIDYTLQGVIERLQECDLWESDWVVLDDEIGEDLAEHFERYWESKCQVRRSKEKIEKLKKLIPAKEGADV